MTQALTPRERARLSSILARLASPYEGERAAAGLLASAFVAKRGLAWADLTATLALLHGPGMRAQLLPTRLQSGDADGDRASRLQHAVERVDGNVHLGRPALVRA